MLVRVVDDRSAFQVFMEMVVTQPDRPFPRSARLRAWQDFSALVPDPSAPRRERATLLDWELLLGQAVQLAYDAEVASTRAQPAAGIGEPF